MQPEVALVPRIDTRSQRVPHAESDEEEHWEKLTSGVVQTILTDPDEDKLIQKLPSSWNNTYTHVGENAKMNIWLRENTAGFDLCKLSEKVQCTHCCRHLASVNICCWCATLFPKEQGRSGDIGTNTQAEPRTIRSVNISQVSFEENVQRGNRCGATDL